MATKQGKTRKKSGKLYERIFMHKLRSVRRVLAGESMVAVGRRYGDTQPAVSYWMKKYREHGVEGLRTAHRSGRPSKLSNAQRAKVGRFIASGGHLTGAVLAQYIKDEFKLVLTVQHCRRLLATVRTR